MESAADRVRHMSDRNLPMAALTAEVQAQYASIYERLHTRWNKNQHRASAEAVAFMLHLSRSGPLTVGEACQHFDRAQSAMSELVQRLEDRGLVTRFKDGRDRRRTLVWLSDAGLTLLNQSLVPLDSALLSRALERMSGAERNALSAGLAALVRSATDIESPDHHTENAP